MTKTDRRPLRIVTGHQSGWRTTILTAAALVAFAANVLLCRLAIADGQIDPASYTSLRLASGALTLWAILAFSGRASLKKTRDGWVSAIVLCLYAVPYSFAYVSLDAGTGALILFCAVQITMLVAGYSEGHRLRIQEWLGLLAAFGGLVYLVFPGISAPAPLGSLLMAVAGIAWGIYSLRGRGAGDPVAVTAATFVRALPFALIVSLLTLSHLHMSARGAWIAVASGSLASGIGYIIWYAALKGLTTTRASIVQLAAPVLSAIGGIVFLSEAFTARLAIAGSLILGGIATAILGHDDTASGPRSDARSA